MFSLVIRMVQFPSFSAYDNAFRLIGRKGRLYRLERVICCLYTRQVLTDYVVFYHKFLIGLILLCLNIRLNRVNGILSCPIMEKL